MAYPAQIKHQAIQLRKQGLSLQEISHQLHLAKSTASVWLKHIPLSPQAKQILETKRLNRHFKSGNQLWRQAKHRSSFTTWDTQKIAQLKKLYHSGLSMRQVGGKMDLSVWAINSAMKRYQIKRRPSAQTNRIQFYQSPLSFNPKKKLTLKEQQLKTAGLMLYWAEGAKKFPDKVDLANSDPLMIKLFVKFLRKIYRISESRLRCQVYCYPSHNVQNLASYWSNITQVPLNRFTKPYIRKDGGNIRDKMKHGLVHIRYSDKRLLQLIMKEIRQIGYNI